MAESEIVEIPITEINSEEPQEIPENPEPAPKPKPKPKGRPKGSLGKKKQEETTDDVSHKTPKKKKTKPPPPSESEEEEKPSPKRRRATPRPQPVVYEPPDTRTIAAEVLAMLSNRHLDRSAAKREKYRSWLANPI